MNCKICNSDTTFFYKGEVLKKYTIDYFKCSACGFIQTEEPYWLNEAYGEAIAQLDIGLLSRNIELSGATQRIIDRFFSNAKQFLDYGGGYGLFVRMMRDKGFSFYRYDIHCKNIFAKYFDVADTQTKKFDLLTAFEVFEHLTDPMKEVKQMLGFGNSILLSTIMAPASAEEFDKWWYRAPLSGQHISFFTLDALSSLAKQNSKKLYSNGHNLHLITDLQIHNAAFNDAVSPKKTILERVFNRLSSKPPAHKSLLEDDYKMIESLTVKSIK